MLVPRRLTRDDAQAESPCHPRESLPNWTVEEQLRRRARALAESKPPRLRLGSAHAFCAEVAKRYWQEQKFRSSRHIRECAATHLDLDKPSRALAEEAASYATGIDPDAASYFVGRLYTVMLPEDQRSELGVYYTPPAVAVRLIEIASATGQLDWASCRVLDPACGGGAFLAPIARRMLAGMQGADRRVALRALAARLSGFEVDAFAAWLSRVFLDVTLGLALGSPPPEDFDVVRVCDSLTQIGTASFDLVIGNPPYGRVRLSKTQRERFERSLYGHANMYGLFLDLGLQFAKPDGAIAYVTPTGFLCGEYFKRLRQTLASCAPPSHLEFMSEREGIFDDVLQETLLAVFRRGSPNSPAKVTFAEDAAGVVRVAFGGEAPVPPVASDPWIVARTTDTIPLASRLRRMRHRLADWGYSVSTGPLVWNRFKARLRQSRVEGAVPLIWAESVSADGTFSFRSARRNHSPYFLMNGEKDVLVVRSPCVLLQRTTAKEQARRLIAAELPKSFIDDSGGAVAVENHLNMIRPIDGLPKVSTLVLSAFLNSSAADRAFRCISGTVAVSAYELESMPLPPPGEMRQVAQLLDDSRSSAEIEQAFHRLYSNP